MAEDMTGRKYGSWAVLERADNVGENVRWLCECQCGDKKKVYAGHLRNGQSTSCGCARSYKKTHGLTLTKEYVTWISMKTRCYNSKNKEYKNYGGRGIKVCDRWLHSFEAFISDMGERPHNKNSIDRINNNGNYEPANCKWSTPREQSYNRRSLTNKSGVIGVTKHKGNFLAQIGYKYKSYHLGTYRTIKEAIDIRELAEKWVANYELFEKNAIQRQ